MTQFLLIPMPIQPPRHDLARYKPAIGNGRFVATRMQLVLQPMLVRIAKRDWRIEMPPFRYFRESAASGRWGIEWSLYRGNGFTRMSDYALRLIERAQKAE